MLIYMDCCCLNRLIDDQTQDKIRIESNAIVAILFRCFYGHWKLVGSDVVEYEIIKTPDANRMGRVLDLYRIRKETVHLNDDIVARADELQRYGIKPMDSLHFASAEYGNVDVLLSVDRDFINKAEKVNSSLRVANPVNWFMEEAGND